MSLYLQPVRVLLKEMAAELARDPQEMFTRQQAIEWFAKNYPNVKTGTVNAHLVRFTTNAKSRVHHVLKAEDDLFFQINAVEFRRYDSTSDPLPIRPALSERAWVDRIAECLRNLTLNGSGKLDVFVGKRIPYRYEVLEHDPLKPVDTRAIAYETDLVIAEVLQEGHWKPRLIIEAKITSINTHDAITYSQKATSHKSVYPYLRYGIILGNRRNFPLPGRLYRHGIAFDFMMSFKTFEPTTTEIARLNSLILEEVRASQQLEKIIYDSRKKNRDHFTVLHRKLHLECADRV